MPVAFYGVEKKNGFQNVPGDKCTDRCRRRCSAYGYFPQTVGHIDRELHNHMGRRRRRAAEQSSSIHDRSQRGRLSFKCARSAVSENGRRLYKRVLCAALVYRKISNI